MSKAPPPYDPEEKEEQELEQEQEQGQGQEQEEKKKEQEKQNSNCLDCIADKVNPGTAVPAGGEGDQQVASSTASSTTTTSSLRMEAFQEIDKAISRLIGVCGGGVGESACGGWGGGVGGLRRGGITASARSLECIALR